MGVTTADLAHALRRILPDDAGLGHADFAEVTSLDAPEDLGPASPARVREFGAGRLALRRAMRSIDLVELPVRRAPDRGPLWPKGVIGSITHAGRHALAVVARTRDYRGLGIDLVVPADWPEPDLWPLFLQSGEYAKAQRYDAAAALAAKEAAIKLLRDVTGLIHDFLSLSVLHGPERNMFYVRIDPALPCARELGPITGKLNVLDGHVLAVCALAPLSHARNDRSPAV